MQNLLKTIINKGIIFSAEYAIVRIAAGVKLFARLLILITGMVTRFFMIKIFSRKNLCSYS